MAKSNKVHRLNIRVSDVSYLQLVKGHESFNKNNPGTDIGFSEYLRQRMAKNKSIASTRDSVFDKKAMAALNKIGSNINQIARGINIEKQSNTDKISLSRVEELLTKSSGDLALLRLELLK